MEERKLYDRTEALNAMYELKYQGYRNILLKFTPDGALYLGCDDREDGEIPDIDIDFVESWATTMKVPGDLSNRYYWWIFD
jgi:hypothetical protein